jgi:hypothetical protein
VRCALDPDTGYEPSVRRFGRLLPRSTVYERVVSCFMLVFAASVLALATRLTPDPRGIGTHEQVPVLGDYLKPCGFHEATGYPCPACGYTTTFAYAAHGRLWAALKNQPFGFFLFLLACGALPACALVVLGKVSIARWADAWPWQRILPILLVFWLCSWLYKIEMMR